ncbi:metal-dependent hydrolase [Ornithobacterium rhinotracheale]|uniref:metal-dependent hydrolase n=1 Tax=Ornithobacterium rhinotracheale TaxID=28251 RepID=UPI00129D1E8E|nr:metal-dependent hydrolase [Ornithobacterium rhinotracheale]MRI63831.1 metal-dependent hydrolase [Ornithobacterium rhinotracheale]
MKIQFLGHACLLIETEDKKILVDPFISGNPKNDTIKVEEIKTDYILLTHAHQDHVLDAEEIAKNNDALIISNAEIAAYYEKKGLKTHGMNTGGSYDFDFGRLTSTIAFHSSSFADGTYGGNPNGYILKVKDKQIYISGDTSLTYEMKYLPLLYGNIDLAVLPIGGNFTMDALQASFAAEFLQTKRVLGYHYDTFPVIEINHKESKEIFNQKNTNLELLNIGEFLNI